MKERLLEYAALLHDVGYHIGYARHHQHGHYLVMNGDLRGFTAGERAVMANVVRYHRRAFPKKSHKPFAELDPASRCVVRRLAAVLRIADALDRSHFSVVQDVRCRATAGDARFVIQTREGFPEIPLDVETVKDHAGLFEKLFGVTADFEVRHSNKE